MTGAVAGVLVALDVTWPVVAGAWLTAAFAGTALAVARLHRAGGPGAATPVDDHEGGQAMSRGVVVSLVWATGLAGLSLLTQWSNPDDLYYVNLSQWVVDHGTFPVRDTIFSDLVFPMASWPPVASYDALAGTVARLVGVHAASIAYFVVPPVATFLAVLAMWRLLREWRVESVGVALSLALVFLLFDGGPGYASPGNLFLTRIWQGKVILLCLMVPLLLVYALRYVDRPTRTRAAWLFAGGVAAVGLSTTALFLVPLIAVGAAAPLLLRRRRSALLGFAAMAAYPLAAGLVTLLVGGHSADLFETRQQFRFDPAWFGPEIFRAGPLAAIAVAAALFGTLLVPHRSARVTTGVLAIIAGVTFVPGVTRLSFDLVGLGPTLWRVSWISSIAVLVGLFGAQVASSPRRRSIRIATGAAFVVVLAASGAPIWSSSNGVTFDATPRWKREPTTVVTAQEAIAASSPGDVILAPEQTAITITVLTTRVKTVAPRDYFMDYLKDDPRFRYDQRLTLLRFADPEIVPPDQSLISSALTDLDVDLVCLPTELQARIRFLRGEGYQLAASSPTDNCLAR